MFRHSENVAKLAKEFFALAETTSCKFEYPGLKYQQEANVNPKLLLFIILQKNLIVDITNVRLKCEHFNKKKL